MRVTIAGLTYVWPAATLRTAPTTSLSCASRVRNPLAPALSATENCSVAQRQSSAMTLASGQAERIASIES